MYAIDIAAKLSQIWIGIPQVTQDSTNWDTESPGYVTRAYLQPDTTEGTPIVNTRLRVYPIPFQSSKQKLYNQI